MKIITKIKYQTTTKRTMKRKNVLTVLDCVYAKIKKKKKQAMVVYYRYKQSFFFWKKSVNFILIFQILKSKINHFIWMDNL